MIFESCCFTGHRKIDGDIYDIERKVRKEVVTLISRGVKIFYCGGAIGFDMLCGKIILDIKKAFPSVKLYLALPCTDQNKYYSYSENADYELLKKESDKIYYASDHYTKGCMHLRNRFMVDSSNYVISYCTKNSGGTFYTLKYATEKGREIISI